MKQTLYLIRHGTAQHNVLFQTMGKRVFYDTRYIDTKLTHQGIEEAQQLGKTWNHPIDVVFTSSLTRTLETANHVFKDKGVPIIALDILKEFPQGLQTCNQRSPKSSMVQQFPNIQFHLIQDEQDTMWRNDREETINELNQRIHSFNDLLSERQEMNIAIVCHNSFIGQYKDGNIGLLENGDKELLHCHPYIYGIQRPTATPTTMTMWMKSPMAPAL
jgi:broad specificity phosphatase PhoE